MGKCCSKPQINDFLQQPSLSVLKAELNDCTVSLSFGNILKSPADTFLAIVDKKGTFNTKQIRQIRLHGGISIITQLKATLMYNLNNLQYGQVLYTGAGDLNFKYILFGILPQTTTDTQFFEQIISSKDSLDALEQMELRNTVNIQKNQKQYLYETISNALLKTEQLKLRSICLPVITFDSNEQTIQMTFIMMTVAIKSFLEEHMGNLHYLKRIDIITNNQIMVNQYSNSLSEILRDSCQKLEKKSSYYYSEDSPYQRMNMVSPKQNKFSSSIQTKIPEEQANSL